MAWLRVWHSYLSVFLAPTVIFLSFTGALQVFNLHEAHDGYQPPALIEKLSRVHKDQVFALGHPHPAARQAPAARSAAGAPPAGPPHREQMPLARVLLKWLLLLEAVALVVTTAFGIWIGLTHATRRRTSGWLLAAGALIPLALLLLE